MIGVVTQDDITVLVVDDHPVVRESVASLINAQPGMCVVGTAGSKREVYAAFAAQEPDVAIVDVALSDSHGLELIQDLRAQFEKVRFIVFSMYDEYLYAERAVQSGAHGYVMKSQSTESLIQAIRMVRGNDFFLSKSVLSRILRHIGPGRTVEKTNSPVTSLTARELEVYQLLGQGHDATRISEKLSLSRKTVETYRRRIKEKLELETLTALMHHAMKWTDSQSKTTE